MFYDSRLVECSLASCLLPLKLDKQLGKITFKARSMETLKFCCIFYSPIIALGVFWFIGGLFEAILKGLPNTMEKVTFAGMVTGQYINFVHPFPLANGLSKVSTLVLSKDLSWPSFGLWHLIGYLIAFLSLPLGKFPFVFSKLLVLFPFSVLWGFQRVDVLVTYPGVELHLPAAVHLLHVLLCDHDAAPGQLLYHTLGKDGHKGSVLFGYC